MTRCAARGADTLTPRRGAAIEERGVSTEMCGIAGIFSRASETRDRNWRVLEQMTTALAHRGPDGQGLWSDEAGSVFFGHRRLAIIDLTEAGAQPMRHASGAAITFNGEIYNYLELKKDLTSEGVVVEQQSDTAVLLSALVHWGPRRTLEQLVGMFAFAFWEPQNRTLYLARDRAGKKPIYYTRQGGSLYFASEIGSLLRVPDLRFPVSSEAIAHYLSLGFVPSPHTIYDSVEEVASGHLLAINRELEVRAERYWSLPVVDRHRVPFQEAVEEVDRRLNEAVKLRLRADVPVGAFLSGGIDSGIITAMAARQSTQKIRTFTVGFDVARLDETPAARLVADRYATEHEEIRIGSDLDGILAEVVRAYDEPIADTSILPTYIISREASRRVKVVLNGEGSDEIFGGYRRHLAVKYYGRVAPFVAPVPRKLWAAAHRMLPVPRGFRTPYSFLHRFLRSFGEDSFERYLTWSSDGFTEGEKTALLRSPSHPRPATSDMLRQRYARFHSADPLTHFMALDFELAMEDCLLVKLDMATMAHGLEARCPFLDHRLAEWCMGLDFKTLLPGHVGKPLLRSLAARYLPEQLVHAPKRGFEIPLVHWMKDKIRPQVREVCLESRGIVSELMDRREVERLLDDPSAKLDQERWAKRVWILFMLAMWHKEHRQDMKAHQEMKPRQDIHATATRPATVSAGPEQRPW